MYARMRTRAHTRIYIDNRVLKVFLYYIEILDKTEYISYTDERDCNRRLSIEFVKTEEEPYTHIFNTTQFYRLYLYYYTIRVL